MFCSSALRFGLFFALLSAACGFMMGGVSNRFLLFLQNNLPCCTESEIFRPCFTYFICNRSLFGFNTAKGDWRDYMQDFRMLKARNLNHFLPVNVYSNQDANGQSWRAVNSV